MTNSDKLDKKIKRLKRIYENSKEKADIIQKLADREKKWKKWRDDNEIKP